MLCRGENPKCLGQAYSGNVLHCGHCVLLLWWDESVESRDRPGSFRSLFVWMWSDSKRNILRKQRFTVYLLCILKFPLSDWQGRERLRFWSDFFFFSVRLATPCTQTRMVELLLYRSSQPKMAIWAKSNLPNPSLFRNHNYQNVRRLPPSQPSHWQHARAVFNPYC